MNNSISNNRDNCISLIRIIAALQVIMGHMIEHLELPGNEIVLKATFFLRGVPVFFAISGFLMWMSIERTKSYKDHIAKRFWRIFPELWVSVLVELLVIIVLYDGWEIKSLLLFFFTQSTIFQFWTPASLRGYGVGTPNGALWTIGVMIQFYIIIWVFNKLLTKRKMHTWLLGFIVSFTISKLGTYILQQLFGTGIITKLYDQTIIKYFWIFYIGMFIAEFREDLLPILKKYWLILLTISFAFFCTGWDLFSGYYLCWSVFLVAGLIGFSYHFPSLSLSTDISYGLFLFHMTVVNIFVHFHLIGNWGYALLVVIIASSLAFVSTITVGRISSFKRQAINV